ncbi:MAG TPA: bifunctional phosphopantothenoylcysteine decarboxylase/phosphopantothenate--cysteine ligase CoaBC [Candidatus Acidoferrales bacterium]|jgi:phosphopantothenoylcysteine decarboxylase/phosphopantothenate--cysteine ligase|nr:bifunctional phosphopantothenoylcysteine decarboxylase/phosphopantothenate--cysteine ligase CoaBC [Candidatus Acidoferrales bacterium]
MKIALGVTGGVAAYKAAELVRRLQQEKLDVQVVMTRAAQEFITPLTFAALTGQKVITDMFSAAGAAPANVESAIEHIAVAQRIDLFLVAPATADILGKFAHGIAEDFLTTLYLATKAPVVVAPAMNVNMWEHAATQENLAALRARGVHVVDPDEGYLACGMTGAGRLASTETIAKKVCDVLGLRHDLAGQTVLVTAGPTCEDIDPVRFLTNRSSGKMGYALAEAAHRRGARVILVSGPTDRKIPEGVDWVPVRATEEMRRAVLERAADANIVIMAAAVADYRPAAAQEKKIKRGEGSFTLELEPTPDILAELGQSAAATNGRRVLVGFAAETDRVAENARGKLERKSADMIVANDVTQEGAGFDCDTNIVTIYTRDGREIPLSKMSKFDVANRILDQALALQNSR